MKIIRKSIALLLIALALSCNKDNNNNVQAPITATVKDIYTCGYEYNGASKTVAKYWKNGVASTLYQGT